MCCLRPPASYRGERIESANERAKGEGESSPEALTTTNRKALFIMADSKFTTIPSDPARDEAAAFSSFVKRPGFEDCAKFTSSRTAYAGFAPR
jgi:hypothetical protein